MFVSFVLWSLCLLLLIFFSILGSFVSRNPFLWTLFVASVKLWVHSKIETVRAYFRSDPEDDQMSLSSSTSSSSLATLDEGIDEPGDLCVMDIQHCPEYSLISYAYRHMQYRMVFGMSRVAQLSQFLEVEFEMLGTHSVKKVMLPILQAQKPKSDIILKVTDDKHNELPGKIEECIIQLFGPFVGEPDKEGLFAILSVTDPNGSCPRIIVNCLDTRFFIDRTLSTIDQEEITTS